MRRLNDHTYLLDIVAKEMHVPADELTSASRSADLVLKRHEAMYAIRYGTELSFPAIGRLFRRDHTTVMHGVERVLDRLGPVHWPHQYNERVQRLTKAVRAAYNEHQEQP
jgi:chromosomal replication initiation ATPase DnaA